MKILDEIIDTSLAKIETVAETLVNMLPLLKYGEVQEVEVVVFEVALEGRNIVSGNYINSYKFLRKTLRMDETEFNTQKAKILDGLPTPFQDFISVWCWNHGHAYGFEEVINIMEDLAHEVKLALDKFMAK